MFIDTHTHLFFQNFEKDLDEVIKNAIDNNVTHMIVPGTDLETSRKAIELAERYEQVYAAVGIHPHDTKDWDDIWIEKLLELSRHPKVVAIGEIGLDYYYDFSPREIQLRAFEKQIELALETDLPIIVHNRESNDDIMNMIRKYSGTCLRAQFHCFAGSAEDARELVSMDHMISFTGNITFKKADTLREIASSVQIDNILLETDSPFLTPEPYRGKRNEPANVRFIAEKLAELNGLTIEDIARATTVNAFIMFGIGNTPEVRYTYQIKDALYVNITNRCNADCVFCDRAGKAMVKGYNLKMKKSEEKEAEAYIEEIGDPKQYSEIVFCGYGEPTIRWETVSDIARYVKNNGGKTRLNTNGHGNFINKRDITPDFDYLIDTVSISLNSPDEEQYAKIMRVDPRMYQEMLDFALKAKRYAKVVMTIVDIKDVDKKRAKELVSDKLGIDYRERPYF